VVALVGPRHSQDGDDCRKHVYSSGFFYDFLFGFFTGGIDFPQIDYFHYLFYHPISRQKNGDCEFSLKMESLAREKCVVSGQILRNTFVRRAVHDRSSLLWSLPKRRSRVERLTTPSRK
jgi:hypothetical protein